MHLFIFTETFVTAMYLYLKYRQQWDHAIQRSRKKSAGKSKRERRDFGAGLNLLKRR